MQTPGHLSDIFRTGTEVVVADDSGNEFPIWVMRPSGLQQEQARDHANAKVARYKLQSKDKNSDTYLTLRMHVDEQPLEDAIESRLGFEEPQIREAALNEVLYGEVDGEESEWSKDEKYLSVLNAISDRASEIEKFNGEMEEGGSEERIDPDEDEKLQELMEEHERFQVLTQAQVDKEMQRQRDQFASLNEGALRAELLEKTFELDTRMQWYEAYQLRMLAFGCRYVDDHRRLYFDSADDVYEVPVYIRTQLFDAYNEIERGSDNVKNSLSLLNS